jgi:hypothetical protein
MRLLAVRAQILLYIALEAARGTLEALSTCVNDLVSSEMVLGEKLFVTHDTLHCALLVRAHVL